MAYLLHFDTATKNCSVSLSKDGTFIIEESLNNANYSHGEQLHVFIETVVSKAGISFKDLAAVCVGKGPGSYTGLRIGVSAAKGLCFALDIPLIAVNTLEILAAGISRDSGILVPMIDARRLEVFSAIFDTNGKQIRETQAQIIDENSFQTELNNQPVYFLGDGAEKCKEIIKHENAFFIDNCFPTAKNMVELSYQKFSAKDFEDVAYFEPFYLKDFVATKPKNK